MGVPVKHAYIVASNAKYLPGLTAILNSLQSVGNAHDVIVLPYNLPAEYISAVDRAGYSFTVLWHPIGQQDVDWLGEAEVLMRKRYYVPTLYAAEYDSFCILDADMFFGHNVDRYLEIAAKTSLVLGCTLEQKRRYGDANHQYPVGSGNYIIDPEFWNARDLCCAPLFVGPRWYGALKKSWDIVNDNPYETRFKAPDMDALNICLIEAGSFDRTIPLSQHTWTGLHECLMKAHTRAIDMHGRLFTEDGEEINVVHGQYWNKIWRGWQIDNQLGMVSREFDNSESYLHRSRGSFEFICNWFYKVVTGGPININDFIKLIPSAGPANDVMEIT